MGDTMRRLAWMVLLLPALARADVPATFGVGGLVTQGGDCCQFSYQGAAIFRLYDAAEGGNKAWEEQQASITVDGGMFHAELGAVTAFGATTFDGPRWLEIELPGGPGKLAPRTPLSGVPFAMFAGDAKKVGGVAPADLARKADVDAALAKKADLDALKHVSGSRLKARWLEGGDGSRQFVDWWDTVLQKACTVHLAADGEYRCLPKMNSSSLNVYYDYTCGKQVVIYVSVDSKADAAKAARAIRKVK